MDNRHNAAWGLLFIACTFMYGCYGPLVQLSQVQGKVEYDTAQVVFLSELLKLSVSLLLLHRTEGLGLREFTLKEGFPYFIPAFGYFFNNNISFLLLSELDPATYSVLSNLKVLVTTILYVLIMRRNPNILQVLALTILTLASVIHSYGLAVVGGATSSYRDGEPMQMRASVYGVLLLMCSIMMTSFSAVYTEYIMKRGYTVSLYKQNTYLYLAGIMFNLLTIVWRSRGIPLTLELGITWVPFKHFNKYTWLIVFSNALLGFCVSYIMKYSTNITRLVLNCSSLVVVTLMSMMLFDLQVTPYFLICMSMVLIALVIYNIGSQSTTTSLSRDMTASTKPKLSP